MRLPKSLLPLLLTPTLMTAQPPTPAAPSPLALFARLVGEWEGEATVLTGPGARRVLRQTERVEAVAGGTAYAVRGVGHERQPDGSERVTFDAFAVIFVDHDRTTPRMRTFTMQGGSWTDPAFTLDAQGYRWSITDPRAGVIRYEMHVDPEGRWIETGTVSRDGGTTWTPIFSMRLARVPSGTR